MNKLIGLLVVTAAFTIGGGGENLGDETEYRRPEILNMDEVSDSIGYPDLAQWLSIDGKTVFRIHISRTGDYLSHELIAYPLPILSERISEFIPLMKFQPATVDHIPVDTFIIFPYGYDLLGRGRGPEREYRYGLHAQLIGQDSTAVVHFTNSIDKGSHLFQLNAMIQRAVCSYRIGDYEYAKKDFQWILSKRKKFVRKWRKRGIDLIHNRYILALERQELHKLIETGPVELNSLSQAVLDAFTP